MVKSEKMIEIDFEPVGRRIQVESGTTILEAAQLAGVELTTICGGVGSCGACKVRIHQGEVSPLSRTELQELLASEIQQGVRFACQAKALGSMRIDIPPESLMTKQRLQVEGSATDTEVDPVIRTLNIRVAPPHSGDLRSDTTRLRDTLEQMGYKGIHFSYPALTQFSKVFRMNNWQATIVLRENEIVAVLPFDSRVFGFAVDIGTTKIAAYLVSLESGEIIAKTGEMNPQIGYGEDVISRIAYANDHVDGLKTLQTKLVDTLNGIVTLLCKDVGISIDQVVDAVIVGNTAMHHIFFGLPVEQLGSAPYVPCVDEELNIPATVVGLKIASGAYIFSPPNIAGYVGSDHVSMLLAAGSYLQNADLHTTISLDIGTNTEISLHHWGRHLSCSCASGPAFEGAHISDGMRAAPGAIERVKITSSNVKFKTVSDQPAVGICGSGILDAVSEMVSLSILDYRGVFVGHHPNLVRMNGNNHFILASQSDSGNKREVAVNRKDINEIQLAKGAIRAGVETLLLEAGILADQIDQFVIAGAFGTYLDLHSAINIGMFPDIARDKYKQIGNAAGLGAIKMLVSARLRKQSIEIARNVEYIELTTHPKFVSVYMMALSFGSE